MTYVCLLSILIVGFLLRLPRFRDPAPSDFGAHLYLAQTWGEGRRLYLDLPGGKPPAMYYLYMAVYRWWGKSPEAIRGFIALWYSLTTVSVFMLARVVWHNDAIALCSAAVFAVVTSLPQFWSSFSHAENFMLLPETLAVTLFVGSTDPWVHLAAGIFLGISFEFKPTSAVLSLTMAIAAVIMYHSVLSAVLILAGHIIVVLLPLPYFCYIGRTSGWQYFCNTINILRLFDKHGRMFRGRYPAFKESQAFHEKTSPKPAISTYVKTRYQMSFRQDIDLLRSRLRPILVTTAWFWLLVAISVVVQWPDAKAAFLGAVCLVGITVAIIQRSYFPSHFLPAVPAAALLTGWLAVESFSRMCTGAGADRISAAVVFAVSVLAVAQMVSSWYVLSFVVSRMETLSVLVGRWSQKWIAAEEIASIFSECVDPCDYVLQFGNEPQIYYVSDRRPASNTLTWVYPRPHPLWRDLFTRAVNQWRPAKIVLTEPDAFDMSLVSDRFEPKYQEEPTMMEEFRLFARVDEPVDLLRLSPPYLVSAADDGEPRAYTSQTAPTAPFISLIVLGKTQSKKALLELARSLDEQVEIVVVKPANRDSYNVDRFMKVLRVAGARSTAAWAYRGIQVARGDRWLFVAGKDLPDADLCRRILTEINGDTRVGIVAPCVMPARMPIAVRAAAVFRVGGLNREYDTAESAFTQLVYNATWLDFRCKNVEPISEPDLTGFSDEDQSRLREKTYISIKQLAEYYR